MQKLEFKIEIDAPREKVWEVLWNDKTYPQWTRAFGQGGRAESDWQEGSRIHFLADDDNGTHGLNGMYSLIDKKIDNEYMAFKHLGVLKDGIEQPLDEESKKWAGSMETYKLTDEGGKTILETSVDIVDDHVEMFNEAFPEAFRIVKELSEQ